MDTITILILTGYGPMALAIGALWRRGVKTQDKYEKLLLEKAEEHSRVVEELLKAARRAKGTRP